MVSTYKMFTLVEDLDGAGIPSCSLSNVEYGKTVEAGFAFIVFRPYRGGDMVHVM